MDNRKHEPECDCQGDRPIGKDAVDLLL